MTTTASWRSKTMREHEQKMAMIGAISNNDKLLAWAGLGGGVGVAAGGILLKMLEEGIAETQAQAGIDTQKWLKDALSIASMLGNPAAESLKDVLEELGIIKEDSTLESVGEAMVVGGTLCASFCGAYLLLSAMGGSSGGEGGGILASLTGFTGG